MLFMELAKKRYSVRSYRNIPVEEEKLRQILEAGRIAPSAVNFQPLYFIVVREPELKKRVAATYRRDWIQQAPAIIVVCGDHSKSWRRADGKDHCDIDAAIAIDHMTLAAVELGLGTCWVCAFNSTDCHTVLNLPAHIETIALLPLGYPADEPDPERHAARRKKMEEMICWDGFNK
ncbi:nitroreductase family protein [Candidatus Formimonas warabiya]|uniref:Nitroreductase n=1 Tax=Formimonas warabiya TaxID=1761012 RepID=A0A3G1KWD7_FORW1|nr:nitroreductase family protein [Candidatus Formimonas warabiya]ATW26515.1 nitroreductase [Candidatus Formimonas warabiya]